MVKLFYLGHECKSYVWRGWQGSTLFAFNILSFSYNRVWPASTSPKQLRLVKLFHLYHSKYSWEKQGLKTGGKYRAVRWGEYWQREGDVEEVDSWEFLPLFRNCDICLEVVGKNEINFRQYSRFPESDLSRNLRHTKEDINPTYSHVRQKCLFINSET